MTPVIGSEIQKTRPAVVISNNVQNKIASRIVVLPITSNINKMFPFEAQVHLAGKQAKVITDQIRTIDKSRIGNYICKITKSEMHEIERALKITLSLE